MYSLYLLSSFVSLATVNAVTFQALSENRGFIDNGTSDQSLKVDHLFYDETLIDITVASNGRALITHNRQAAFCHFIKIY